MSADARDLQSRAVPLAIVGIGCIFPKAGDTQRYWANVRDGVDAITEVPESHWRAGDYFNEDKNAPDMTYARRGGFVDPVDFDPLLYGMSPNNIEATDTTQLLGMVVARQALLDAGYATGKESADGRAFDRSRASVILGVTGTLPLVIPLGARLGHPIWRRALAEAGVDADVAEDVVARIADAYVPWQENSFPGLLGNVAAGRIANRFDLGGTNCVVDAACASSLSAIHLAAMELAAGRCDMAISGGFDTFNDIFMYMCFSKTPALSPTGNSRPFDADGDGTILGEGLGAVVLKRLDDARRDGDHIYAVLRGIGSSSDGRGHAIYAPSAEGQMRALKSAYQDAGISPRTIELLEAHGTGTKVGDAVEAEALSAVFREDGAEGTWCAIGSVKSMIGHTKAAAGVAGLIKVALALDRKVLPPTIKVERPLDVLDKGRAPVYVNARKRPWVESPNHPRRAAVSAFGFGGSNFHCVLEEAQSARTGVDWDGNVLLFAFSADRVADLKAQLAGIEADARWETLRVTAARTLPEFDPGQACRLILVADRATGNAGRLVRGAGQMLTQQSAQTHWQTPDGAFFGSGPAPGKLAWLFPGQGAQYPDMLLDLACQFPEMLAALCEANSVLTADLGGQRLSDLIYPVAAFSEGDRDAAAAALRDTRVAQPAIGAVSMGALRILEYFGIQADAAAGHSFGELTALHSAGWFDGPGLLCLAGERGRLMHAQSGDQGAMLAVAAGAGDLHALIEEQQLDLIVANHNAPAQAVLSGATGQIEKAKGLLEERGIRATRLPVSAAFHSSFVSAAEKPFLKTVAAVKFQRGAIPVFANSTAEPYPDAIGGARELLAGQLARPVQFVDQIRNMHASGVCTFVEIGPGATLGGLVRSILQDADPHMISLDASRGSRNGQYDLACLLARLAVLGHRVDIARWDAGCAERTQEEPGASKMTIKLTGANHVESRPSRPPVSVQPARPPSQPGKSADIPAIAPVAGNDALEMIQQSIVALQNMQEQTAELHRRYLEGQEGAQRTIRELLEQQQRLLSGQALEVKTPPAPKTNRETPVTTEAAALPEAREGNETPQAEDVRGILLEVVSEKTGYPADMLSLDMSLDTDLGIDSIKRVEILSALQERLPGFARIQPEDLGTFKLLEHIVEFLAHADVAPAAPVADAAPAAQTAPDDATPDTGFSGTLMEVVAEKTGYPAEMLNLEMNLDTDLGIDSIKRVEILSTLQERVPGLPKPGPEDLAALQTLRQIVEAFSGSSPAPAPARAEPAAQDDAVESILLEVVAAKTGYPPEMLNPDMNLDTDLGVDSIKRVEILSALQERLPGMPAVGPEELAALHTLGEIARALRPGAGAAPPAPKIPASETPGREAGVDCYDVVTATLPGSGASFLPAGEIWVTEDGTELPAAICRVLGERGCRARTVSLDQLPDASPGALVLIAPPETETGFVRAAIECIRRLAPDLRADGTLLAGICRLGGAFGLEGTFTGDPASAALGGMIKTCAREWPEPICRVIDVGRDEPASIAGLVVDGLLRAAPLEICVHSGELRTVGLAPSTIPADAGAPLDAGDLVVVSGGARGVTAAVALAWARAWGVNLLILGRTPLPAAEPDWLVQLRTEPEIKKALVEHGDPEDATPRAVEQAYQRIAAAREIRASLDQLDAAGVTARYAAVDIRDRGAVTAAVAEARADLGPVRGIVHGAGVLMDRHIEDKTWDQFSEVFSTKVDGIASLLAAAGGDDLRLLVLFSSSTARLGRIGQVDYAAANEVLNKVAQQQAAARDNCRVMSVNWGPWDGGMVNAALKRMFAGEGVNVIAPGDGAAWLVRAAGVPGAVETVVLGRGSRIPEPAVAAPRSRKAAARLPVAFERGVSVENCPVLRAHVINGKAVLPMALIAEWLGHAAMHDNPGLQFHGFDDLRILKGVILDSAATASLQFHAGPMEDAGAGAQAVPVEMRSGETLHASARIRLAEDYDTGREAALSLPSGSGNPYADGNHYRSGRLFHGTALHAIETVLACDDEGIAAQARTAPPPAEWMQSPVRSAWLADPLVLDAGFQLMILWCFEAMGIGSLPTRIGCYRQFRRSFPRNGARITIRARRGGDHGARADVEITDDSGSLVARMEDYECVADASLDQAFVRNRLEAEEPQA